MPHNITARRLYTDIGSVEFPVLTVTPEGNIGEIYSDPKSLHRETTTLTAAFLDIHTHGAVGHDVMTASPDDLHALQRFYATRGVANYLPTTVTASVDDTLRALDHLATEIESWSRQDISSVGSETWVRRGARPIGIHLEGPFLSHAKRGVHPTALLQPPSIELFERFQAAARGHIKLLTIAPEPDAASPGPRAINPESSALELIRHATKLGVRCSLGHSNATAAQALAAIGAGASSATHTFNAMRPLDHREPGLLGTVLMNDGLYAELICDGIHVAPELVALWLKTKGADRAILVTDSMSATGMPDGLYSLVGLPVRVANGRASLADAPETLAGSVLTMDTAVLNVQRFTGTPLADAVRLGSHNPAAMLGLPELTRIAPGSPANLNRFSAGGELIATYLLGAPIPMP